MHTYLLSFLVAFPFLLSCQPKIDTGRNDSPQTWPADDSQINDDGQQSPSDNPQQNGNQAVSLHAGGCFDRTTATLAPDVKSFCDNQLSGNPLFSNLHNHICKQGHLVAVLGHGECGWNGSLATMMRYIHVYSREPQTTGKNYNDIHATISNPKVSAAEYMRVIRLAFEDYNALLAQGKKWIPGTTEQTNLNHGNSDTGVDYRFRIDRDVYTLGYNAHFQMYKLSDHLWVHLNYATGEFVRVTKFVQVTFYQELADGTVQVMKIEDKEIESQGLYVAARSGSNELMKDFFIMAWKNVAEVTP